MAAQIDGRPACDRCKGQKLRCIWEPGLPTCNRCSRAQAVCQLPKPRPVGRPRGSGNANGNRSKSSANSNKSSSSNSSSNSNNDALRQQQQQHQQDADLSTLHMSATTASSDPMSSVLSSPGSFDMQWNMNLASPAYDPNPPVNFYPRSQSGQFNISSWEASAQNVFANPNARLNHSGAPPVSMSAPMNPYPNLSPSATLFPDLALPFDNDGFLDASAANHVDYLKQLGELNVALYQHPLSTRPGSASDPGLPPSPSDSSARSNSWSTLPGLQIGQVLSMTYQLRGIARHHVPAFCAQAATEAAFPSTFDGSPNALSYDRCAVLLILSCYMRLELIYTHALDALAEIRRRDPLPDDSYQLMPELEVDGYSLGHSKALQLTFVIQLCEQTLALIQENVQAIQAYI